MQIQQNSIFLMHLSHMLAHLQKGPEHKKMFADATIEQICIDIDLHFEGDRRELMHIL